MTILTTIFGPARRVTSFGTVLYPDRITREGVAFHIETPDFVVAAVEFANGAIARLTTDFYVGHHSKQKGIEFHGDRGSLYLSDWQDFNAEVAFAEFNGTYQPVPYVKEPHKGPEWCRGLLDMADAIADQRPQRITGEQAAHVVELLCAIKTAYEQGHPVEVTSSFAQPAPMDWAL